LPIRSWRFATSEDGLSFIDELREQGWLAWGGWRAPGDEDDRDPFYGSIRPFPRYADPDEDEDSHPPVKLRTEDLQKMRRRRVELRASMSQIGDDEIPF
jgi:hypothetical protein